MYIAGYLIQVGQTAPTLRLLADVVFSGSLPRPTTHSALRLLKVRQAAGAYISILTAF